MQSGYTCHRCLHSLRGTVTARPPTSAYRQLIRSRWKSTTTRQSFQRIPFVSTRNRRTNASSGPQKNVQEDEPSESYSPLVRAATPSTTLSGNVLLQPNNLFHPFSDSPRVEIRRRAAFTKTHAYCPHPSHHRTRMPLSPQDPESRKIPGKSDQPPVHVRFECPDCGIPVYCSEDHWADDYESHMEICDTLREINEDDHDLRSDRFFPEFEYPIQQMEEILVNMTNWDTYLYSREYNAIDEERPLRQVTRLLTYPLTIGSILSELSPYEISSRKGGRLTPEGLRSLAGISPPIGLHPVSTNSIKKHSATPSIHPVPEPMTLLKAYDPTLLLFASLF